MNIQALKSIVEEHREHLTKNAGKVQMSGPGGPIGIGLIDAVVAALERLDIRLTALEDSSKSK